MRLSNSNLRLCVGNRFLERRLRTETQDVIVPEDLLDAAADIEQIDAVLGQNLKSAFAGRKESMPIDQAMEIVDLYLKQRTEP